VDKQGKAAMKKLARPRKPQPDEDPTKIYWHDDPKLGGSGPTRGAATTSYIYKDAQGRLYMLKQYNQIDTDMNEAENSGDLCRSS
jgi:hypothetical protein